MVDMSTPTVHSAMLCVSAYEGDLAEARRFLSAGTPVDALAGDGHVRGYTALTATCGFSESTEMVDLLLEHGACIDKVNHYGRSPLMCAVINGSSKMSQHLSERGAALDLRHKNGMTALDYARKAVAESRGEHQRADATAVEATLLRQRARRRLRLLARHARILMLTRHCREALVLLFHHVHYRPGGAGAHAAHDDWCFRVAVVTQRQPARLRALCA